VLVIRHLNKAAGGHALYRGGGSIGIIGAARLGLLLGRPPESEDALVLATTKSNIAKTPGSLALRVVSSPNDADVGVIEWTGLSTLTAQDLVASQSKGRGRPAEERTAVEDWLAERLADGEPHAARDLWEAAEEKGFAERTVRRAVKTLGVVVEHQPPRPGGTWYWSLPDSKTAIYGNIGSLGGDGASKGVESTPKPAISAEFARVPEIPKTAINQNGKELWPSGDEAPSAVQHFGEGERVMTPSGPGVVTGYDFGTERYVVTLDSGQDSPFQGTALQTVIVE
ncbi:MAG TPA: hypothetical protein VFG50_10585, partial [Rhodothermales bacterium]|nr:hypothetical protein [Rhodothermales bacterium]